MRTLGVLEVRLLLPVRVELPHVTLGMYVFTYVPYIPGTLSPGRTHRVTLLVRIIRSRRRAITDCIYQVSGNAVQQYRQCAFALVGMIR